MAEESSTGTGCSESASHPGNPKYGLRPRSIINRIETERRRSEPAAPKPKKKETKSKHKPPPLSKYRRKNANARERHRMHEINMAFESLRRAIPSFPTESTSRQSESQLTKITTLRLAMNYITALSDILKDDTSSAGSPSTSSMSDSANSSSESLATGSTTTSPEPSGWSPYCHMLVGSPPSSSSRMLLRDDFLTPSPTPSPDSSPAALTISCSVSVSGVEQRVRQVGPLPPVETLLQRPAVDLGPPSDCLSEYLPEDDPTGFSDVFDSFAPLADFPDVSDSSIDILLESDGESLTLSSDFSDQPTP